MWIAKRRTCDKVDKVDKGRESKNEAKWPMRRGKRGVGSRILCLIGHLTQPETLPRFLSIDLFTLFTLFTL